MLGCLGKDGHVRVFTNALVLACAVGTAGATEPEQARRILDETGVRGGLVMHLGCGDGRSTALTGDGHAQRLSTHAIARGILRSAPKVRYSIAQAEGLGTGSPPNIIEAQRAVTRLG